METDPTLAEWWSLSALLACCWCLIGLGYAWGRSDRREDDP